MYSRSSLLFGVFINVVSPFREILPWSIHSFAFQFSVIVNTTYCNMSSVLWLWQVDFVHVVALDNRLRSEFPKPQSLNRIAAGSPKSISKLKQDYVHKYNCLRYCQIYAIQDIGPLIHSSSQDLNT